MTIAEKITRAKADYDAVYEAGKAQGGGKPTLYGTYAIKEDAMGGNHWATETFEGKGVNAYFYDPRIKEYVNLEIDYFYIGTNDEGLTWKTAFDENGLCLDTTLYYQSQEWASSIRDISDSEIESAPLPDAKGRLVIFPEPTVVSEQFYNRFKEISDTSEDIFGEGYDKAYGEVEYLNTELATSLYGGDTGYKGYYDEFWDAYQDYGKRTHYAYAFGGLGWNAKNFKPKYSMTPQHANNMFMQCGAKIDLVEHLKNLGLTLDLSQVSNADNVFNTAYFTRIGIVNFTSLTKIAHAFSYCGSLVTIDKIIVTENLVFSNAFVNCKVLEEVRFEGVIGQNGLNLQYSPLLSKASIENIINHLSTSKSGLSVTLSKTAVESAFGSTTSAEWTALIGTRSNWTISLV